MVRQSLDFDTCKEVCSNLCCYGSNEAWNGILAELTNLGKVVRSAGRPDAQSLDQLQIN